MWLSISYKDLAKFQFFFTELSEYEQNRYFKCYVDSIIGVKYQKIGYSVLALLLYTLGPYEKKKLVYIKKMALTICK